MKARAITMMAAAMTVMSAFAQEQVADVLAFGGSIFGDTPKFTQYHVSDLTTGEIVINEEDPLMSRLLLNDKWGNVWRWHIFSVPETLTSGNPFSNAYFFYRDTNKLLSPTLLDLYAEGIASTIIWEGVENAAGYELNIYNEAESFDKTFTLPADVTSVQFNDLEYGTRYIVRVRALHPSGNEEYHSDWCGRLRDSRLVESVGLITGDRYPVPGIMNYTNRTQDGFTVIFDLKCEDDMYREHFEVDADNNFVVTALEITSHEAEVPEKYAHYMLTAEDLANGYVKVSGLESNTQYIAVLVNDNIPVKADARYNYMFPRTKGTPADPVLVENEILSDVLSEYAMNPEQVEGQVFYLSGDKTYRLTSNVFLTKGMTIETLPEDVAQGKRAKVLMSDLEGEYCYQFMFNNPSNIVTFLENFVFRNIDFDVPIAKNYGSVDPMYGGASGNYFLNMYSYCGDLEVEKIEISNCTFTGFIRGFVRVQGSCYKKFDEFTIDGCLFYNCGYYDNNGRGYAWIAGDGANALSNLYKNFNFTNNTIYDSPRTCFITDNNKDLPWRDDVKWNITIENNTFVNFSTRTTARNLIEMRFVPSGSHFSVKRNLFVLAADDTDQRNLYMAGADIRTVNGRGILTYDIADNYSVGCRTEHMQDDGIFNGGAFSATRNSFGMFGAPVSGNMDDLKVKALSDNGSALKATDLFTNPNPPYVSHDPAVPSPYDHAAPDNIYEALKYKYTPAIITEKNIGDPRWRN